MSESEYYRQRKQVNNDSGQTANVMTTVEPELVSEGTPSIRKIVVAVDLSEHSDLTIRYAVQIAKCFNSSMVLVHVFDSEALCPFSEEYSSRLVDQERDECEVALARLSDAVRDMKVDCKSVVLNGDSAKRIKRSCLQKAKRAPSPLILFVRNQRGR